MRLALEAPPVMMVMVKIAAASSTQIGKRGPAHAMTKRVRPSLWICRLAGGELSKGDPAKALWWAGASFFHSPLDFPKMHLHPSVCNMEIHSGTLFVILQRIFTTIDQGAKCTDESSEPDWAKKIGHEERLSLVLVGSCQINHQSPPPLTLLLLANTFLTVPVWGWAYGDLTRQKKS